MPLDPHPTPRKKSLGKPKRARRSDIANLNERLKAYPNLREKLVEVLDAADNKGGVEEADAAEELVVGLMRDLGHLTLQTWADNQTSHKAEEFAETHPEAENKGKKTSLRARRNRMARNKKTTGFGYEVSRLGPVPFLAHTHWPGFE